MSVHVSSAISFPWFRYNRMLPHKKQKCKAICRKILILTVFSQLPCTNFNLNNPVFYCFSWDYSGFLMTSTPPM